VEVTLLDPEILFAQAEGEGILLAILVAGFILYAVVSYNSLTPEQKQMLEFKEQVAKSLEDTFRKRAEDEKSAAESQNLQARVDSEPAQSNSSLGCLLLALAGVACFVWLVYMAATQQTALRRKMTPAQKWQEDHTYEDRGFRLPNE